MRVIALKVTICVDGWAEFSDEGIADLILTNLNEGMGTDNAEVTSIEVLP